MDTNPKHGQEHQPKRETRNIDDTYTLDADTEIYKPKTIETAQKRRRQDAGTTEGSPFFTHPRTDWGPVILAGTISIGTLILLIFTVRYTRLQWQEMINGHRPWVSASEKIPVIGSPSFELAGDKKSVSIRFQLSPTVHNFGDSPAYAEYDYFSMYYVGVKADAEKGLKWVEQIDACTDRWPRFPKSFRGPFFRKKRSALKISPDRTA